VIFRMSFGALHLAFGEDTVGKGKGKALAMPSGAGWKALISCSAVMKPSIEKRGNVSTRESLVKRNTRGIATRTEVLPQDD